jgi:hypothetical protein
MTNGIHLWVKIPFLDGQFANRDEFDTRNQLIDELEARGFGKYVGAGSGEGSMDFSFHESSPAYASSAHTRGTRHACSTRRSTRADALRSKTPCQRTLLGLPANLGKIVAHATIILIPQSCTSVR